jgi:hypothetical protein
MDRRTAIQDNNYASLPPHHSRYRGHLETAQPQFRHFIGETSTSKWRLRSRFCRHKTQNG